LIVSDGEGVGQRRQDSEFIERQTVFGSQNAQPARRVDRAIGLDQVTDPAVVAGRAAKRDLAEPADIDWYPRRRRLHLQPWRPVELTVELRPAGLPQCAHQLEHFVGASTARRE